MIVPNLASRPFMNTRPVWLLTALASAIAIVLLAVDVHLYYSGSRKMNELLAQRDQLIARQGELDQKVRRDVASLSHVPWKALDSRVVRLNGILDGHAFSWLTLLDDLGRVLPRQVRLYQVAPTITKEGIQLSLRGTARTRAAMIQMLQNMIADPHFFNPLPRSESTPEASKSAGYDFMLRVGYQRRETEK